MNQEIISLRKDSSEINRILLDGLVTRYGEKWAALPREVSSNPDGIESVVFEIIRPHEIVRPSFFQVWANAMRLEDLVFTLVPGLMVLLYGLSQNWNLQWILGGLSFLGILLLHLAVNLLNDVEDHLKLLDLPGTVSGSGVLQRGWLNARFLKRVGLVALSCGVLLGIPAVLNSPAILLGIAVMGAAGVAGYSNRPFSIKYRVYGEFSILLLLGPLLSVGYSIAFFGKFSLALVFLGLSAGFLAWAIHHAGHISHILRDETRGTRTVATALGFRNSRVLLVLIYLGAYSSLGVAVGFYHLSIYAGLLGLAVVPWVVKLVLRIFRASGPSSALLSSVKKSAAQIYFWSGLLISLGLGLAFVF